MKKYVYYLIYLLALIMMVLCSSACRSPKTMTYSQATTDSVKLSIKDSSDQRFEFTFDSLELWSEFRKLGNEELRKSQAEPLPKFLSSSVSKFHHAVIYGGKLSSNSIHSVSQDSTSSKKEQEVKNIKIRSGPVTPALILFDVIFLLAIVFLLIRLRSSS